MLNEQQHQGGAIVHATTAAHEPDATSGGELLEPAYAQFRDQTRFWIQRVAVPLIMVVGLFGNLITVIIMTRRRMRSTTNMYLAALAFVDMLYLVLTFLLGLSHYPNMAQRRYYLYWKLRPFLMMLTDSCSNTSVWLTVTFTIERFIAVRYPMKGKVWCTEARAKRLIVCVFLLAILSTLPVPFEWKVIEKRAMEAPPAKTPGDDNANAHEARQTGAPVVAPTNASWQSNFDGANGRLGEHDDNRSSTSHDSQLIGLPPPPPPPPPPPETTTTRNKGPAYAPNAADDEFVLALDYSDFGRNENYKTIYYWSTAAIFYFIPLLSLTFFNGFLIHSVHRSRRERNKMINRPATAAALGQQQESAAAASMRMRPADSAHGSLSSRAAAAAIRGATIQTSEHSHAVRFEVIEELAHEEQTSARDHRMQRPHCPTPTRGASPKGLCVELGHSVENVRQTEISCDKSNNEPAISAGVVGGNVVPQVWARCSTQRASASSHRKPEPCEHWWRAGDPPVTRLNLTVQDNNGLVGRSIKFAQKNQPVEGAANKGGGRVHLVSVDIGGGGGGHGHETGGHSHNGHNVELLKQANSSAATSGSLVAPAASSQERRITIMLISVVILFLFCQIPTAAMLLYTSVHDTLPNTNEHALLLAFGNIFNFLMAINAAGNFILYSFLSKKYRRTFVILFCGCLRRSEASREAHDKRLHRPQTSFLSTTHATQCTQSTSNESGQLEEPSKCSSLVTSTQAATSTLNNHTSSSSSNGNNESHLITRDGFQRRRCDTSV